MRARSRVTCRSARFTAASLAAWSGAVTFAESTGAPYTSLENTPLLASTGAFVDAATVPVDVTSDGRNVLKTGTPMPGLPVVPTVVPVPEVLVSVVVPGVIPDVVPGVMPFTVE